MVKNNLDLYKGNNKSKKSSFNIKDLFNSLSMSQKISIILIAIVALVGIFMVFELSSQPEYVALYSNLNPEDTAAITKKLDEAKIKYEVSDDGTIIRVEQKKISNARLLLAEQGLPVDSTIGFEIFDQQFFGLTDFTQKVNYQRALEGELSKTISSLDEVESVRVHLVLPESDIFSDEQTNASASIVLKLKTGAQLKSSSVRTITNFVSSSVKDLKKENITIADTQGNLLSSGGDGGTEISDYQNMVDEFENGIEKDLNVMLTQIYGGGNIIVRVNADINFDKKESEVETYVPKEDGKGIVLSESNIKETYDKNSGTTSGNTTAGTGSNVPDETNTAESSATPSYAEQNARTNNEDNNYLKDETSIQYVVSKKIEKINSQGGNLEKMSIGIFVNKSLADKEINDIKSVVSAAAGLNEERGDSISIKGVSFTNIETTASENDSLAAGSSLKDQILSLLQKYFSGILLLIVLGLLTFRAFNSKGKSQKFRYINSYPEAIAGTPDGGGSSGNANGFGIRTFSGVNTGSPKTASAAGAASIPYFDDSIKSDGSFKENKKVSDNLIKNRLREVKKQPEQQSAQEKRSSDRRIKYQDDYIPPEPAMNKYTKLKELIGDGVSVSPDLAKKILKHWIDEGR